MAYMDLDYINNGANWLFIPWGTSPEEAARIIKENSPPGEPRPAVYGGPPGGGAPSGPKAVYVGVLDDEGIIGAARAFVRFMISDLPGALASVRLEWYYVNRASPTGDVSLIEVADFIELDPADWGIAEIGTITTTAITPVTQEDTKLSIDVTTAYNAAKAASRTHLALKLQYETEDEGVGPGRWYQVGATGDLAPHLVLLITPGQDMRLELIATPLTVDLARADALGTPAGVITAGGESGGVTYPPLGETVQLAATIDGLQDDVDGTYTGTPGQTLGSGPTAGVEFIHFLWRNADVGAGIPDGRINLESLAESADRLSDWFRLAGGLTQTVDVREWVSRIARSCRSFTYVDQTGRETMATEPPGGSGITPIRTVLPWEHGRIRCYPLIGLAGAVWPFSRLEVQYGFDYLGLEGWHGHAKIAPNESNPADPVREAQAIDAQDRYGRREPEGLTGTGSNGYEWVSIEEPGFLTGIRLLRWQWDQAQRRPELIQVVEVELPRFALTWRLMDEFYLDSYHFPSALARLLPTHSAVLGSSEPEPNTYQCRRARCSVRDIPRLLPEAGATFPVSVTAMIIAWESA